MGGGVLQWSAESRNATRIVAPVGRVDEATSAEFGERLIEEAGTAAGDGSTRLVVDLAGIEYMSSRGLRALTLAQRRGGEQGVTIILARPGEVMREILAISRYDLVFKVTETLDDALSG